MKYKLIAPVTEKTALIQVLCNRNIPKDDILKYTQTTLDDVNPPEAFGEEKMRAAAKMLLTHIKNNDKTIIIVDPDVDGNTSAALLINFLYQAVAPQWVIDKLDFYFHEGKQHGLNDCYEYIIEKGYNFVICPDSGSNDYEECDALKDYGIDVLVLDHHDFDTENPYAIIINNQEGYSDYPNKALSGVGVVWQFCRYLNNNLSVPIDMNDYLDLVAIGLVGDMMDIRSIETKTLINEGLKNLNHPYIYHMAKKNAFKLGTEITPIGAAFYIVPLLNAIQRSGTLEEKKIVFDSMLIYKAYEMKPSTKRGHKLGEVEMLVDQAVRVSINVKNRQTKVQDATLEILEKKIEEEHLLDHKVLLILIDDKLDIPAEVRGLIANKFMAKYQRPCCLLSKSNEYDGQSSYAGSARGCSLAGVDDFKSICLNTENVDYAIGHSNAFGLKIYKNQLQSFIEKTDETLKDMSDEAIYYVDYIFQGQNVDSQILLDIANMSSYWGTELNEPYIAIEKLKVTPNMVNIYEKKTNTIKISLSNGVSIMKFDADQDLCDKLTKNNTGYIEMDIVGKCHKNEWNGIESAQIFIEDFNIIDSNKYYF